MRRPHSTTASYLFMPRALCLLHVAPRSESIFGFLNDSETGLVSTGIQVPYTCMTNESTSYTFTYVVRNTNLGNILARVPWRPIPRVGRGFFEVVSAGALKSYANAAEISGY